MADAPAVGSLSDAREPITFVSSGTVIDLTNCDREPIHIPGAVQPHGVLLALREPGYEIVQVSASVHALCGVEPGAVLGQTLANVLGPGAAAAVRTLAGDAAERSFGTLQIAGGTVTSAGYFDVTVHRSGGLLLLELEPAVLADALTIEAIRSAMRSTISRVEQAESLAELAQGVAEEMREITGFDRVWVYRFHPDWHGEIIGEAKREDIETWLGMHYPASDIPAQARALFLRNLIRLIPDLSFVPSPLVPPLNPLNDQPLDLGGSVLRSVSPIHVQYLNNMGVTASLVISLIHRGKLWGLISGHHYSGTKRVSYAVRTLCEFLAQALSLHVGAADRLQDRDTELVTRERNTRMLAQLAGGASLEMALTTMGVTMSDLVAASGSVLVHGSTNTHMGRTPDDVQLSELVAWLRGRSGDLYLTSRLPAEYPAAGAYADIASGLLATPLSQDRRDYLLWFRGEQRQTVRWAGDPRKPVTLSDDGSVRLHPRGSFALWEEEARGTAAPWRAIEIEAARDLRRAVLDVLIRRAEEIAMLNAELMLANAQLEESALELEVQADQLVEQRTQRDELLERERSARAEAENANRAKADFLAMVSHELRTPLNAIGGYAQLMALGIRGATTKEQQDDLERIQINQRHLLGLINSIMNFTRLGAGSIQFAATMLKLRPMLDGLDALIGPQVRAKSLQFAIEQCDARLTVRADEEKLLQILLNLLTNALKFTPTGGAVTISCIQSAESVSIMVRDTGRGIEASRLASVFDPFVQIDRHITPHAEQGIGLGLAISRELARGMKGDLTAISEVGVGSTFTLILPSAD
jgi:chemotaxis family two-component system sensor kinase Cph1